MYLIYLKNTIVVIILIISAPTQNYLHKQCRQSKGFTEKLWVCASPFKGIEKENIPDVNPEAFLRNAAQTARGTDN